DELAVFRLPGGRLPGEPRKRKPHKRKPKRPRIVGGARMTAARHDDTWHIVGRIPTAEMPMAVDVTPAAANPCGMRTAAQRSRRARRCMKLLYVSGKGLGTGPNPQGPQPTTPDDSDDFINRTQYLPLINDGQAGVADFPTVKVLAAQTATAERQIVPTNAVAQPPADTPLRAAGPIKHVFYIVRENRTYDQVISYFNYGEAVAGVVPLPDKDRTGADTQQVTKKLAKSDLGLNGCYPNDSSIGTDSITGQQVFDSSPPAGAPVGSESRADCFARHLAEQVATGSVPAFNYLVLTNDHTQTLSAGARTPRAMVADNDEGLGR